MIIEGVFSLLLGLIRLLLGLIPNVEFNLKLPDLSFFREAIGMANYFFPFETLVAAIAVIITVQNSKFILKIFTFVLKRIPFIG
ncbi:hypothetical protein WMI_01339 [Enterococcus faecalis EnGen0363]|uniref:hypothetical protein n=1 Tax=Enterococcus faecalis TaxID=1351 RepID=UPI00032FF2C7|nr:hypothetical protein [Enterococcus faecalis]EGO5850668.1 hypothetical protein [Enterococcus faecalis]EJI7258987.1 hypothetical protein [Enterococcus faecalis]EOJ55474.1 hypothetical protein WMI_01339 [Enterococcus faecalis EnGen0363]NSM73098.1 hypothetical protein [Enterococcus faecalis]NSM80887.1 hypothetical protein [Enterococcus faecalis]